MLYQLSVVSASFLVSVYLIRYKLGMCWSQMVMAYGVAMTIWIHTCSPLVRDLRFELYAILDNKPPSDMPMILIWDKRVNSTVSNIENCDGKVCYLTYDSSDLYAVNPKIVLMYGPALDLTHLPLPRNGTTWALVQDEPYQSAPFLANPDFLHWFNITSTFSRSSHIPITHAGHVTRIQSIVDTTFFKPVNEKNRLLDELAPIIYIQSNCNTYTDRDAYVAKLMNYIKIDSYGRCLRNKEWPQELAKDPMNTESVDFKRFVGKYKFFLSIENTECNDYITEKFWRPISLGVVPIYYGSPNIRSWWPNNDSAVLIEDFETPEQLAYHVKQLNQDDDRYNALLKHKLHHAVSNMLLRDTLNDWPFIVNDPKPSSVIDSVACRLCQVLHSPEHMNNLSKVNESHYHCKPPLSILERNTSNRDYGLVAGRCSARVMMDFVEQGNTHYEQKDIEHSVKEYIMKGRC